MAFYIMTDWKMRYIRSRRHRDKQKALQCNTCATLPSRRDRDRDRDREKVDNMSGQMSDKTTPGKET